MQYPPSRQFHKQTDVFPSLQICVYLIWGHIWFVTRIESLPSAKLLINKIEMSMCRKQELFVPSTNNLRHNKCAFAFKLKPPYDGRIFVTWGWQAGLPVMAVSFNAGIYRKPSLPLCDIRRYPPSPNKTTYVGTSIFPPYFLGRGTKVLSLSPRPHPSTTPPPFCFFYGRWPAMTSLWHYLNARWSIPYPHEHWNSITCRNPVGSQTSLSVTSDCHHVLL